MRASFRGDIDIDIDTVADALVALLKHLAADFVTPMGVPTPQSGTSTHRY
ncbi:hypothetical protein [Nocardia abscessus]|nr:hypothetical protein [Nocardia abscessus]